MIDTQLQNALADHPFTRELSETHRAALGSIARILSFPAGTMMTEEGQSANDFYLILSGQVAIEIHSAQRGHITIQTLGTGDVVGWSWLIPPHIWQFDARCVEEVTVLSFDAVRLRQLCKDHRDLGYELLYRLISTISARLSATRVQLLDLYQ